MVANKNVFSVEPHSKNPTPHPVFMSYPRSIPRKTKREFSSLHAEVIRGGYPRIIVEKTYQELMSDIFRGLNSLTEKSCVAERARKILEEIVNDNASDLVSQNRLATEQAR